MKPEERANIMKTLKELTEKISQLKNEISNSNVSQATGNAAQPKTKTDVRRSYTCVACSSESIHVFTVCVGGGGAIGIITGCLYVHLTVKI